MHRTKTHLQVPNGGNNEKTTLFKYKLLLVMNGGMGRKGICYTWFRGRHFSPSLSGDRYLKLGSKSDHGAEISWNIVQYDALAPRPEGQRSWYFVFACACFSRIELSSTFVDKSYASRVSYKHCRLLLELVSFFVHEKRGLYNRSDFIMSIDKPNLGV